MRAFVIGSLTVALAAAGAVLDLVWAVSTDGPWFPSGTILFGLIGLLIGWGVARLTLPRPTRPLIDPARYPNRVIRRG